MIVTIIYWAKIACILIVSFPSYESWYHNVYPNLSISLEVIASLGHYIELDQHLLDEKSTHTHIHTKFLPPLADSLHHFPFRMKIKCLLKYAFLHHIWLVLTGEKIVKPITKVRGWEFCEYFANSLVWKRCNKHYISRRVDTFTASQNLEHIWKDYAYLKITYIGQSEPAPIGVFYWLCL
jgi:hypothetical protein